MLLTGNPRHIRRTNRNHLERRYDSEQDYRLAFYQGRADGGLHVTGNIGGQILTGHAKFVEVLAEQTLPLEVDNDVDSSESMESLLKPSYEIVVEITAGNGAVTIIRQQLQGRDYPSARSQSRSVSAEFPVVPPLVWLGTDRPESWAHARRYSALYRLGGAPLLLNILKEIEPRLNSLVVLTNRTEGMLTSVVLEVDIGLAASLPLESMGDGFSSTIAIMSAIGSATGGLCLIDEVENGLHYSLLPQIWRSIAVASDSYNAQVWATTHSYDCISAAFEAFANTPDLLRVHRLERADEGNVAVHSFDHEMLGRALERGLEVR